MQKCLLKIVRFYNSSSNGTKIEGLAKGLERERASVLKIFNENGVEEDAHSGEKTLHDVFGIVEKRHQCLKQLYIPERDTLKQRK